MLVGQCKGVMGRPYSPASALSSLFLSHGHSIKAPQSSSFSTTATMLKKSSGPKLDSRITLIRYYLQHPRIPAPLRLNRARYLRHWTIHRAWNLHQRRVRQKRELELERQYSSMREACEALRLMDRNGMSVEESKADAQDVGRLYRIAMLKHDVWQGVPIEYARIQTDTPSRNGWNHDWKR